MTVQVLWLVAIAFVAIATAIGAAHVAARAPAAGGPPADPSHRYGLQRTIRRYGPVLGVAEAVALVVLVAALVVAPPGRREQWLLGGAALCVAASAGVGVALVRPLST